MKSGSMVELTAGSFLRACNFNYILLMANIINVLIIVDTANLVNGGNRVYLVSDHPGDHHEGSPELTIVANVGDFIRWRSVAVNARDQVELIHFDCESSTQVIEQPYFANGCWTTEVVNAGSEQYTFTFSVNECGLYSWDPKIVVQPQ